MEDWQDELKKYVIRKHKQLTGFDLPIEAISEVNIDFEVDFEDLSIKDLGNMYSFALMMEKYEFAQEIDEELKSRNCKVEVEFDEEKKTGFVNITVLPKEELIEINMKIIPTGVMVDFDKLD